MSVSISFMTRVSDEEEATSSVVHMAGIKDVSATCLIGDLTPDQKEFRKNGVPYDTAVKFYYNNVIFYLSISRPLCVQ